MLDYDGTLSPIAPSPPEARALPGAAEVLERLAALPGTMVAVSGRAMADLKERLPCPDIVLFGNHGLESRGLVVPRGPPLQPLLDRAAAMERDVYRRVGSIDGVVIENKGPAVSVHHRLADDHWVDEIEKAVEAVSRAHRARLMKGKKVLELRPDVPVDKGTTARALVETARSRFGQEPLALYAGDDTTYEDAFAALDSGITILVAAEERPTEARFQVRDPDELLAFLQLVERERRLRSRRE